MTLSAHLRLRSASSERLAVHRLSHAIAASFTRYLEPPWWVSRLSHSSRIFHLPSYIDGVRCLSNPLHGSAYHVNHSTKSCSNTLGYHNRSGDARQRFFPISKNSDRSTWVDNGALPKVLEWAGDWFAHHIRRYGPPLPWNLPAVPTKEKKRKCLYPIRKLLTDIVMKGRQSPTLNLWLLHEQRPRLCLDFSFWGWSGATERS